MTSSTKKIHRSHPQTLGIVPPHRSGRQLTRQRATQDTTIEPRFSLGSSRCRSSPQTGPLECSEEHSRINELCSGRKSLGKILLRKVVVITLERSPRYAERIGKSMEFFVRDITDKVRPPLALEPPDRSIDQDSQRDPTSLSRTSPSSRSSAPYRD